MWCSILSRNYAISVQGGRAKLINTKELKNNHNCKLLKVNLQILHWYSRSWTSSGDWKGTRTYWEVPFLFWYEFHLFWYWLELFCMYLLVPLILSRRFQTDRRSSFISTIVEFLILLGTKRTSVHCVVPYVQWSWDNKLDLEFIHY